MSAALLSHYIQNCMSPVCVRHCIKVHRDSLRLLHQSWPKIRSNQEAMNPISGGFTALRFVIDCSVDNVCKMSERVII